MPIDYDEFRRTTWSERLAIFNALSADGKSELFKSQIAGWLERHAAELSADQVELLKEAMELAVPQLYSSPQPQAIMLRVEDLERRARVLLTPEQQVDALTMHWRMT